MDKKSWFNFIPVLATALVSIVTILTGKGYSASVSHKEFSASIHKETDQNDEEE